MGTSRYMELVERLEQAGMGKVLKVYEDGSKLVENGPAIAKEAAEAIKDLLSLVSEMTDAQADLLSKYVAATIEFTGPGWRVPEEKARAVLQKAREALGGQEA